MITSPNDFCRKYGACTEGRQWASQFDTMAEVWEKCTRPDWMLWILAKLATVNDRAYRLYAVWCARNTPLGNGKTTGDLLTDERSRNVLVVAERFAEGKATPEELTAAHAAAHAAYAAADAAHAAALRQFFGNPFKA